MRSHWSMMGDRPACPPSLSFHLLPYYSLQVDLFFCHFFGFYFGQQLFFCEHEKLPQSREILNHKVIERAGSIVLPGKIIIMCRQLRLRPSWIPSHPAPSSRSCLWRLWAHVAATVLWDSEARKFTIDVPEPSALMTSQLSSNLHEIRVRGPPNSQREHWRLRCNLNRWFDAGHRAAESVWLFGSVWRLLRWDARL
jgi:hypothetical protein